MPVKPLQVGHLKHVLKLADVYELQPGKHYIVVADGKDFPFGMLEGLFRDIRMLHPELEICIVGTMKRSKIKIMEAPPDESPTGEGSTGEGARRVDDGHGHPASGDDGEVPE
jgi:hypothetical protein